MDLITAIASGALFGIGLFQLLRKNILRAILGLFIISNAINLFLLSTGAYQGDVAAYANASGLRSDALPQALVLTAIVISMGGISFILSLVYILSKRFHTSDVEEISQLRR